MCAWQHPFAVMEWALTVTLQTRLRLFAWRKLFLLTAKKVVDETLESLPKNVTIRKQYVADALAIGGVAFFNEPDGDVRTCFLCCFHSLTNRNSPDIRVTFTKHLLSTSTQSRDLLPSVYAHTQHSHSHLQRYVPLLLWSWRAFLI